MADSIEAALAVILRDVEVMDGDTVRVFWDGAWCTGTAQKAGPHVVIKGEGWSSMASDIMGSWIYPVGPVGRAPTQEVESLPDPWATAKVKTVSELNKRIDMHLEVACSVLLKTWDLQTPEEKEQGRTLFKNGEGFGKSPMGSSSEDRIGSTIAKMLEAGERTLSEELAELARRIAVNYSHVALDETSWNGADPRCAGVSEGGAQVEEDGEADNTTRTGVPKSQFSLSNTDVRVLSPRIVKSLDAMGALGNFNLIKSSFSDDITATEAAVLYVQHHSQSKRFPVVGDRITAIVDGESCSGTVIIAHGPFVRAKLDDGLFVLFDSLAWVAYGDQSQSSAQDLGGGGM